MSSQNIHQGAAILIVDDDPVNLSILFNFLHTMGFQIFVAQDSEFLLFASQCFHHIYLGRSRALCQKKN